MHSILKGQILNAAINFQKPVSSIVAQKFDRIVRKLISTSFGTNSSSSIMQNASYQVDSQTETSDKVYVQRNGSNDFMTIAFQYDVDGQSKQFNLYRKASEPLSSSLERIKLNINKFKNSKKNKKQSADLVTRETQNESSECDNIDLIVDGSNLDPTSILNADAWVEGATLELNGRSYQVRTNDPQVQSMTLPSCIMKGFIVVPNVNLVNCKIENCRFVWYRKISARERSTLKESGDNEQIDSEGGSLWLKLSEGLPHVANDDDLAHHLRIVCWPSDGSKIGPKYECVSSNPIELGPRYCPFEKRQTFTKAPLHYPNQFRVVSYNILADLYADSEYSRSVLFRHCPPYALEIEYRRQLLTKEILGYNADIICLQEVDKKEFIRTYEPIFKIVENCTGIHDTKGGSVAEGTATFYRNDKFDFVDSHRTILSELIELRKAESTVKPETSSEESIKNIDECEEKTSVNPNFIYPHPILKDRYSSIAQECLARFDDIRGVITAKEALKKRFVDRHTMLQTTLLKFKHSIRNFIVVANTHLYFAPDADHVRLLQGSVCVKYLEFLKKFYKQMIIDDLKIADPHISIVFCGDMNSTPNCGLYKLLTEGEVSQSLPDWSSNTEEAVEGLSVNTRLRFSSSYQNIAYTNYTQDFNGCLDYIYHELDGLSLNATVPLPDHEDVIAMQGIPSDVFPSDHLALIADLECSIKN